MKSDIERPQVENVGVAIVKERNELQEWVYGAYLFNLRDEPIENVLVTSKGYGHVAGVKKSTSVLRHFLDTVSPLDVKRIEPVMPDVFELTNEYWVSFYLGKTILDKKFIFVKGSINDNNMIDLPFLNARGVLIR